MLRLNVDGGEQVELRRDNSSLFRFFGELALYDHVFVLTNEESSSGLFVFSTNQSFEDIADYMMTNDYPAHLNLPAVAECDRTAFEQMLSRELANDLETGIPEDWS